MKILIIGQGLAGTILSFKLLQEGFKVTVVDDPSKQKSSLIAGGMVNPIVFRRLTKSWLIDELFPELIKTSHELELLLKTKLYHPYPIFKLLGKEEDIFWKKKFSDNQLDSYIEEQPVYFPLSKYINTPYGYGIVKRGGWFDIQTLITSYGYYLNQNKMLISENIDLLRDLYMQTNGVKYKNEIYNKVILCQGSYSNPNSFFNKVKYKNTLGEVLTFNSEEYYENKIISKGVFILPVHNKKYKTGSTFNWDFKDSSPTSEGKQEILDKLRKITSFEFTIENHQAGIRPTTHDRRPVAGFIENHPDLGILNGLGSKGILLIPWVAAQLIEKIKNPDFKIHPEIDVNRYYK